MEIAGGSIINKNNSNSILKRPNPILNKKRNNNPTLATLKDSVRKSTPSKINRKEIIRRHP